MESSLASSKSSVAKCTHLMAVIQKNYVQSEQMEAKK